MMAVMYHETPTRVGTVPLGATETDIVRAYSYARGYEDCLAKLASLGDQSVDAEEPEATFQDDLSEE